MKLPIILNERNKKRVAELLTSVQGGCKVRTVTVEDIYNISNELLNYPIHWTKTALEGSTFWIDLNAQTFPRAYKYTPQATIVKLKMIKGSMRITSVSRGTCTSKKVDTYLSDTAKEFLIKNAYKEI
ncbi:hypothetical protein [Dialister micraerophilus]|uniref:Uncharacterized protein n=1 Tax=Dialister micraerophilus UPII 345-E TaxID=910314 RepID=E4LA28_9FIRM|nr:hypothetical protein [Dialister micraerophilus]EFR42360.1 hypothetical protein HMPREF9220_0595 [Dialister micraerophilus UPII 345-E]